MKLGETRALVVERDFVRHADAARGRHVGHEQGRGPAAAEPPRADCRSTARRSSSGRGTRRATSCRCASSPTPSFNHHHGIQTTERFGRNTDPDGDGFMNEMTRADVTAVVGVPGDAGGAGPRHPARSRDRGSGAARRARVRDASAARAATSRSCRSTQRRLDLHGAEPVQSADEPAAGRRARSCALDLTDARLPQPRLVAVARRSGRDPACRPTPTSSCTTSPIPHDPADAEPIDMNQSLVSPKLRDGQPPIPDQAAVGRGQRAALLPSRPVHDAAAGRAGARRRGARRAPRVRAAAATAEQDALIEFLKTLQVLPPGTTAPDRRRARPEPRPWPPDWTSEHRQAHGEHVMRPSIRPSPRSSRSSCAACRRGLPRAGAAQSAAAPAARRRSARRSSIAAVLRLRVPVLRPGRAGAGSRCRKAFPKDVQVVFKHNPLPIHPQRPAGARGRDRGGAAGTVLGDARSAVRESAAAENEQI